LGKQREVTAIFKIAGIGILLVSMMAVNAFGQILDDSTKNVYSARTTFWFTENDMRLLGDTLHVLDTLLLGHQNFDAVDVSNHMLVDLGNNGTATRHLYYEFPSLIGARLGIDAYNPYFVTTDNLRFYDTKSPFIKIKAIIGGQGRSIADVSYSRNINPRWNFGIDFKTLTSDKQIGASLNRGDRNVTSTSWDFYTSYRTENEKYQVLFSVNRIRHGVQETGGIDVTEDATTAELFQYRDSPIKLSKVKAEDYKFDFRLFQKYVLNEQVQLYYSLTRGRHENSYADPSLLANQTYYEQILISTDTTAELLQMADLTNEAGVMGKTGGLSYNLYLKRRYVNYNDRFSSPFGRQVESYGGVKAKATLFDVWDTKGKVEYMQGGLFDIEGSTQLPFLSLWVRSMRYRPGYQQLYYHGNHYTWDNSFEPQRADRLGGELNVKLGPLALRPGLNLTRVAKQVYFGSDSKPYQSGAGQLITSPAVAINLTIAEHYHIDPQVIYTAVTGNDAAIWQIPQWLFNARLYYEGYWFKESTLVQIGTELHWKSTYNALAWNPVVQQFYLQNTFPVDAYLVADLFLNFKVGNARYFAKMTHINQAGEANGYFVSPYYPGQKRVFDLGVTWYFFD